MGASSSPSFLDERIAAIAVRQNGNISYDQLCAAGLTPDAVRHRVARGWLHRRHRGVYLVGLPVTLPLGAETAAVLVTDGVLSHHSVAHVLALGPAPALPHVTLPREARVRGIVTHRADLPAADVMHRHGLPMTTPARTILDLAGLLSFPELDRVVAEAQALRLLDAREIPALSERAAGRRGARALRTLAEAGPQLTRSEAERRFLALLREAGLPVPRTNVRVAGYEVDAIWTEARLVAEIDGYAFHHSRHAWERDRRKETALGAAGYRLIRVTWRRITRDRAALVADVARALAHAAPVSPLS